MTERRIKIFVDAHCFDTEFQGTQTFVRELYSELLLLPNLDIFFGCHKPENLLHALPAIQSSNIIKYPSPGIRRLLLTIPTLLEKGKYDYAHFQNISPLVQKCKSIVTLHDILFIQSKQYFPSLYRLSRKYLFGRSIRNAFMKTTVSDYSKLEISKAYNIPLAEIHVIPNAVREDFGESLTFQEASKMILAKYGIQNFILCVSRIEPRKNQLLLLQKFLELKLYNQKIALVFIGAESLKVPELNLLISQIPNAVRNYFHHFRQVDQEDLIAFYAACRLFIYPSMAEGFGIPPLEAACCYSPVLCSSASALQSFYFFEPYTFNPADADEFERKLKDMLEHPVPHEVLKKIAGEVHKHYSWRNSASLFHNLLRSNLA